MKIISSLLFVISTFYSFSENVFNLICNQNVYIPGQEIWIGLNFNQETKNKDLDLYPTVYISIYDQNQKVILRNPVLTKNSCFTGTCTLPSDLSSGSYILSATVYDPALEIIIEEQAFTIHILGKETGSYFNFNSANNEIKISSIPATASLSGLFNRKTRDKICLEENGTSTTNNEFYCISNTKYLIQSLKLTYSNTSVKEYMYGYTTRMKLTNKYTMPGFYDSKQKQMFQMKNTGIANEYLLTLPEHIENKNVQYLDMFSSNTIDEIAEAFPEPGWKQVRSKSIQIDEVNLKSSLEKAEVISRLFKQYEIKRGQIDSKQTLPVPDNYIETKNYQAFQSTDLFLAEALDPIRLNKTKNGEYIIRLMRTDRKQFYESSPLLIINGVVMNSIQPLIDLPYNEIESLSFYRKINETRKSFGPQARYGVIEVITKSTYSIVRTSLPMAGVLVEKTYPLNHKSYDIGDSHPWFYSLQFIGKSAITPFCHILNDEKGLFLLQKYAGTKLIHEATILVE
jgi:hypothetical protein